MSRASLALVALLTIGCIGVFGYSCATRTVRPEAEGNLQTASRPEAAANVSSAPGASLPLRRSEADTEQVSSVVHSEPSSSQTIPPDTVAKWVVEATGDDSNARAAAIAALATAPRSQAVPVLKKVLDTGEPSVDRPLALRSLRALALNQGDADGGIREVLRQTIYDGGDEAVSQDAQTVLDDIEGDPGQTKPSAGP
jgi:hypothetical protein